LIKSKLDSRFHGNDTKQMVTIPRKELRTGVRDNGTLNFLLGDYLGSTSLTVVDDDQIISGSIEYPVFMGGLLIES